MSQTERVHRGATLLDEQRPGWAEQVDVDRLDMASPWDCVIGQIAGGEPGAYTRTCEALGLGTTTRLRLRAHGFENEQGEPYDDLHAPWVAEIESRRQA